MKGKQLQRLEAAFNLMYVLHIFLGGTFKLPPIEKQLKNYQDLDKRTLFFVITSVVFTNREPIISK